MSDPIHLEDQIDYLRERCAMLEQQLAMQEVVIDGLNQTQAIHHEQIRRIEAATKALMLHRELMLKALEIAQQHMPHECLSRAMFAVRFNMAEAAQLLLAAEEFVNPNQTGRIQ